MSSNRLPPMFLLLINDEGRRFLIRTSAIQFLADGDLFQDTTIVTVAGRPICVPRALDDICGELSIVMRPPTKDPRHD